MAAVSAVLKDLLDNALVDHSVNTLVGGSVDVSAIAPDLIKTGTGESPSLNLYLYRVTPNQGWRNMELPSRNSNGDRLTNPPLALDLHYLLTAYGSENFQAEILLGYAMQRLHENPVLTRDAIRTTLAAVSPIDGSILPGVFTTLSATDLAEQIELVKITPEVMSAEEISKIWAAIQTNYRPSAAYLASVVLIESTLPTRSPLPVLTRGLGDLGVIVTPDLVPPYPTLTEIRPPNNQQSARLGETVMLVGHHLNGTNTRVIFSHTKLSISLDVTPLSETSTELSVQIPNLPAQWPAGMYTIHVDVTQDGVDRNSNEVTMALAPTIQNIVSALPVGSDITFTVTVSPEVLPAQRASLVVGSSEVLANDHPTQTGSLTFTMNNVASGTHFVRLRIDGVESLLVDRSKTPPEFFASQSVTV